MFFICSCPPLSTRVLARVLCLPALLVVCSHAADFVVVCTSNDEALLKAKEVRNKQRNFVWVQFLDLHHFHEDQAKSLQTSTTYVALLTTLLTCKSAVDTESLRESSTKEIQSKLIQLDDRVGKL
ncbi:hypothetical protein GOP47_0018611 [Adiantum capillus-veneris]|uniref:Uncharacterized protein n=1 Tax=Adiantum capillus-veneris TaxID=13818 RepID=A0A9D4UE15_ADICA|nr:hypothetical protein GOP47_0018611 [Adiantum capillus-veneris]